MNIDENNSNILDALNGSYIAENNYIAQPESPILQAIQNGSGGGGVPSDYDTVKNQVGTNTANIAAIQENIQSMSSVDCFFIPLHTSEALILKGANYIDSGLKMDGDTLMVVKGCLPDTTKQAVIVGAYKSNAERTVLKILGQSHKIQSQWASNIETTAEQVAEMDFSRRFTYHQSKNSASFNCSGKQFTIDNSGYSGSDEETPLLLFNQTRSGNFNNGALHSVEIFKNRDGVFDDKGLKIIGARKYTKSDMSFIGYSLIMAWTEGWFLREIPLPDGAWLELHEMIE